MDTGDFPPLGAGKGQAREQFTESIFKSSSVVFLTELPQSMHTNG